MTHDEDQQKSLTTARRLLWLYCILWLVEGALRKWVLPQFSMLLLLIRDPVVLLIYFYAIRARVFPANGWIGSFWGISAVIAVQSLCQLIADVQPVTIIAFGLRTFVLHLPLIWVVPAVFGRKEITTLGRWMLYLAPFLAALMVVQFEVGPDHWLNAATIKGGAQIGSVSGRIRPPAIFSFISGPIHYFTLCAAFIVAGFLRKESFPRWLVSVGLVSTLAAMSVSASRSLVVGVIIVAVVGGLASLLTGKNIGGAIGFGIVLLAAGAFLSKFAILREGRAAFDERWTYKEDSGGSGGRLLADRYGHGFTSAFDWAGRVPLFGLGVGSTSNLAVATKGSLVDVEGEWERVVYEIGPLTGFLYLAFRAALSLRLIVAGLMALRAGNYLCLLFASACAAEILSGNVRQVTTYGYTCVCCGLCLAAFRAFSTDSSSSDTGSSAEAPQPSDMGRPRIRGRGPLAVGGQPVQS